MREYPDNFFGFAIFCMAVAGTVGCCLSFSAGSEHGKRETRLEVIRVIDELRSAYSAGADGAVMIDPDKGVQWVPLK